MHFIGKSLQNVCQTQTLQTRADFQKSLHVSSPRWSSSESGSDSCSFSLRVLINDQSENHDLVIPSPVELSDSYGDGFSLSQHK
jgi:hypothetical protein